MPAATKTASDAKVTKAKRIATQAINKAATIRATGAPTRSTATRNAYKLQAEALVRVARILAGKE